MYCRKNRSAENALLLNTLTSNSLFARPNNRKSQQSNYIHTMQSVITMNMRFVQVSSVVSGKFAFNFSYSDSVDHRSPSSFGAL